MTTTPQTAEFTDPHEPRIHVVTGNLVEQRVDTIVNAANTTLLGGGGVDGAIHRAAGPELSAACRSLGGCPTGQARITAGYRLPARYVVHTPGPIWQGGGCGEAELLASCYRESLRLACEAGSRSIAFPAISTGAYGYPLDQATRIAVREVRAHLAAGSMLERVMFVCFDARTRRAYEAACSVPP